MAAWKVHIAEREKKKKNKSGKGNIRDLCSLGFRCIRPEIHRRGVPSIVKCRPARQWRAAFAEELSDGSKWFFLVWVVVFFVFVFGFLLSLQCTFLGFSCRNSLGLGPLEPTDKKQRTPPGCPTCIKLWVNSCGPTALRRVETCSSVHFAAINNASQRRKQE